MPKHGLTWNGATQIDCVMGHMGEPERQAIDAG